MLYQNMLRCLIEGVLPIFVNGEEPKLYEIVPEGLIFTAGLEHPNQSVRGTVICATAFQFHKKEQNASCTK